jgi:glycerate kinase
MRIVIAPDSFKECLTAPEVAAALARGVRRALPAAEVDEVPVADGGEGTVRALVSATGGTLVRTTVAGPLGGPVEAAYGLLGDGQTAVIEMAEASGLHLVPAERRDPRHTSTRGTGELMAHALSAGAARLLVGLGGSGTNDAGAGMAQALGYRLLDEDGQELPPGGAALDRLAHIDTGAALPALTGAEVLVACDVANPLTGPNGASHVYGPQKGATPAMTSELDAALGRFAKVVQRDLGVTVDDVPGAGAAGGLAAGLLAFAGGELQPGFELVASLCQLRERFRDAELVITGEGRLDRQTANGKTPVGVAELAHQAGAAVVAVAGALGPGYQALYPLGIDAAFALADRPMTEREAFDRAPELLEQLGESVARTWAAGARSHG